MPLLNCPDCNREISTRADFCPHCGCPSKYFGGATQTVHEYRESLFETNEIENHIIAFNQEHRAIFSSAHYITHSERSRMHGAFDKLAKHLETNEMPDRKTTAITESDFISKLRTLDDDAIEHNRKFISRKVEEHKDYFDRIFEKVDKNIMLDDEQRRAIVTEDDYVLLVAGAGTGKTTTMAAKVKYLVDKCGANPEDIIAISYTKKAIGELKERINGKFGIPARINTFHSFAYDIVKQHSSELPDVTFSSYRYIEGMLEKAIFNNKKLMRNLVLFMGYYFELAEDVFSFENLNQYHLYKAQQDYETIKSNLGEYIEKVADNRSKGKAPRTISGEYLRSVQEVQIANFLYLHGLEYEYEPQYPYPIPTARKKYTPDFLIKQGEKQAYLEHYALSENGYNTMFSREEIARYKQRIKQKRALHKHYGTELLETWSYYTDKKHILSHLRQALEISGFVLKQRNLTEVYRKLVQTGKDKYIHKLILFMRKFISQYKTMGYDARGFDALRKITDNPRTLLFLDIAEDVYNYYQAQLKKNNQIDFEDMINDANYYLNEFERLSMTLPYKYIIIDEFQDIARQRFNLTKRLSEVTNAKVIAVGDDWQSIYAFAGSDITLFTRFIELMGSGTEMKITRTYRNSQELIDIAGEFIQKNSTQIRKRLESSKSISDPIVLEEFDDSTKPFLNLAQAVENIIGKLLAEFGEDQEILLLGRYNYDGYKLANTNLFTIMSKHGEVIKSNKYPKAKLTFMTAHSSKGLGFDNVIVLNMLEGKYGFPSQIENDPIMKLVTTEDTSVPFAEERRLFYVALTRTMNKVYLVAPQNKPSRFLIELVRDYGLAHSEKLNKTVVDLFRYRCPLCNYPLKYEFNKNYGLALYICTNEAEICDFMTNKPNHLYDIFKCDSDGCDGYMIVKLNGSRPFYGCTNFTISNCKNSHSIKL